VILQVSDFACQRWKLVELKARCCTLLGYVRSLEIEDGWRCEVDSGNVRGMANGYAEND
jgi:hypothetical protein